jgi:flagellar motor switch protein FliN/FliY
MSHDVDFEPLNGDGGPRAGWVGTESMADLRRLSAVPVDLSVEIGRTRMSVGETLELREGSVVTLDRMAGEPVDLLVNGTPIARGEVVVIDEQFGLRLTQVRAAATASELSDAIDAEPAAPAAGESLAG